VIVGQTSVVMTGVPAGVWRALTLRVEHGVRITFALAVSAPGSVAHGSTAPPLPATCGIDVHCGTTAEEQKGVVESRQVPLPEQVATHPVVAQNGANAVVQGVPVCVPKLDEHPATAGALGCGTTTGTGALAGDGTGAGELAGELAGEGAGEVTGDGTGAGELAGAGTGEVTGDGTGAGDRPGTGAGPGLGDGAVPNVYVAVEIVPALPANAPVPVPTP
jgi:hypothetical protein